MQKILSFLVVATFAVPLTFAASGSTGISAPVPSSPMAMPAAPVSPTNTSLGENKTVSCSSNPAFGTNSCDQCFDGGSVTIGKRLTGLFDNWTNDTASSLMLAYQNEQKKPNIIAFGSTKWTGSPMDESKIWENSSDIIWTPTGSGNTKMNYILGAGQKVKFYQTALNAGYTLEKTDRKNGELVGMMKYPIVFHVLDAAANEGSQKVFNECVAYNLSAPVVAAVPLPVAKTPITPELTKTKTGPTETLVLIVAAFFIAFGLMFSLRKRI